MKESKMMQFNSKELYSVLGDLLRKLSDLEFIVFLLSCFCYHRKRSYLVHFQQEWMWTNSCCRCIMMNEPPDVENSSCLKLVCPSNCACRKWDHDRLCKHDLHFHCTEISLYILSHAVSEAAS